MATLPPPPNGVPKKPKQKLNASCRRCGKKKAKGQKARRRERRQGCGCCFSAHCTEPPAHWACWGVSLVQGSWGAV